MWDDDEYDRWMEEADADAYYDHLRRQLMPELYEEFAHDVLSGKDDLYNEVISQFRSERLQSFYVANPNIAGPPLRALNEARSLSGSHYSASFLLASIAIEVGLKATLLKPILHGLVGDDSVAVLITGMVPDQHNDSFKKVLFGILKEVGGLDLMTFKRLGRDKTLWEEIGDVRKGRNRLVHRAEPVTSSDAGQAIELASAVLEDLFPRVISALNLKVDSQLRILSS